MKKTIFAVVVLLAACGTRSSTPPPDASSAGGTFAVGGSGSGGAPRPGTGGSASSGGWDGNTGGQTGGAVAAGGTSAAGAPGTGGAAAGGVTGTVGSGTGGSTASGGSPGTGGRPPVGGTATGGASTGGTQAGGSGTGGAVVADAGSGHDANADVVPDVQARDVRGADQGGVTTPLTVYVAGDSTVSTYTNSSIHQGGWGQFLQDYLLTSAKVENKAVGGMTARHYIEAGYLDQIISIIKSGDYLLVQFGTNDGNKTATYTLPGSSTEIPYYLDAETDFKTYLKKYVDATKPKGATTIFVTPPPRHSCDSGEMGVRNGLAAYATAMKELGATISTPVVDLNAMTVAYLANISCDTSGQTFYLVKADGTIDSTHFQENGAKIMAGLVAKGGAGLSTLGLSLSAYVK